MPEAIVAKGDDEIDAESEQTVETFFSSAKPVEDPIQVVKRSGGLDVVGRQKVDSQSNGQPDDVWAEEEKAASDKGSHPARPGQSKQCFTYI